MHNDLNLEFRAHGAVFGMGTKKRDEKARPEEEGKMCNFNASLFVDNEQQEALAIHEKRTLSVFCFNFSRVALSSRISSSPVHG